MIENNVRLKLSNERWFRDEVATRLFSGLTGERQSPSGLISAHLECEAELLDEEEK